MIHYKSAGREWYLNHDELVRLGAALSRQDQILPVPPQLVRAMLLTAYQNEKMFNGLEKCQL